MKTIKVLITGMASTVVRDGEAEDAARHRLAGQVFAAEMKANETGEVRVHLSIDSDEMESKCSHGVAKTERCEGCVLEGMYTFAQPKEKS